MLVNKWIRIIFRLHGERIFFIRLNFHRYYWLITISFGRYSLVSILFAKCCALDTVEEVELKH